LAQHLEASGVDELLIPDGVMAPWPAAFWKPEITPLAEAVGPDSWHDPVVTATLAAVATEKLGVAIATDAIRRGPAELLHALLSLSSLTRGRASVHLGAGEARNVRPFGWKRSEGLRKLEDHLKIQKMLLETDSPVDFDGNIFTLRQAWLGSTRPYRPKYLAMGGGPKLIDMATRYGNGIDTAVPFAFSDAGHWAAEIARVKDGLKKIGRDPEEFEFGVWAMAIMHEDQAEIDRATQHPIIKWLAACVGRMTQSKWRDEGIEPVFPDDWHFSTKMLPSWTSAEEAQSIIDRVSPEMVRKSYFVGTPGDVAAQLQPFVEAGTTWVGITDYMPMTLPLGAGQQAIERSIELLGLVKQRAGASLVAPAS